MIIVFLGPDGCGKTTVAERISNGWGAWSNRSSVNKAFNFEILPPLAMLFRSKSSTDRRRSVGEFMSGMSQPKTLMRLLPSFIWNLCDFAIGSVISVFSGRDYIFARYYYDNFYQRSYRIFPLWIIRAGLLFVKTPTAIFILERNPSEIHVQKPELTIEEIKYQYHLLRARFLNVDGVYFIDANFGLDVTVDHVSAILTDIMES